MWVLQVLAGKQWLAASIAEDDEDEVVQRVECVAVCCSVLQRVAAFCSVLQRVAACCSELQRVTACCIMLQCVAANK